MPIKNILLLGGTGTLSHAVLTQALSEGCTVAIMNRGKSKRAVPPSVRVVICDFYDRQAIEKAFKNEHFDVIVDFLSRRYEDIDRIYPFFAKRCKQYIFISSACVYCRDEHDLPIIESSSKPNPDWLYNVQKYECVQHLIQLSRHEKSAYTIVRPYITYDDERIPLAISPPYRYHRTLIERFKAGKPWFVWDDGKNVTTITHTLDFAQAMVGLFLNDNAYNEDFHIVGDYRCTQMELIEKICTRLNITPCIVQFSQKDITRILPEYKEMLIGDRGLDAVFNNEKIKSAIPSLTFQIDIDHGLDRVIEYWRHNDNFDYDYKFDARIDRLISLHHSVGYIQYPHAKPSTRKEYWLYRFLPLPLAVRISNYKI